MEAVRALPTATSASRELLEAVQTSFDPDFFKHYHLPGSPKPTQLSEEDLQRAVEMEKFEPCEEGQLTREKLPAGVFGVRVFYTYEHKRRRRIITDPALTAAITDRDLSKLVHQQLDGICDILSRNEWWQIAERSYRDSDYDHIIYTDASAAGWGALVQRQSDGLLTKIQQQWVHDSTERRMYDDPRDRNVPEFRFQAQHSAHAEPRAAWPTRRHLLGFFPPPPYSPTRLA